LFRIITYVFWSIKKLNLQFMLNYRGKWMTLGLMKGVIHENPRVPPWFYLMVLKRNIKLMSRHSGRPGRNTILEMSYYCSWIFGKGKYPL
jgi:hypothetical protein